MTINCSGDLIDLSRPKVMGILNLTPDSFYDGGRFKSETDILKQVDEMLSEGATFIDIGAYSSRPGADFVSEEDELGRLEGVLNSILKRFPEAILSVDTFRSTIAKAAVEGGASIINDISGGSLDPKMMDTVAELQVPYIMMHMRGNPKNMQDHTDYGDVTLDVITSLSKKVQAARTKKINDIIIDPGFGFSKTLEQNYDLLRKLELFQNFDLPVLVGLSRKSMIYKLLKSSPEEVLNGTTALHAIALMKGAHILRVHDVEEAMECIALIEQLNS